MKIQEKEEREAYLKKNLGLKFLEMQENDKRSSSENIEDGGKSLDYEQLDYEQMEYDDSDRRGAERTQGME